MVNDEQLLVILTKPQLMNCYRGDTLYKTYSVSTGKNGLGEILGSEQTPRGWHCIHSIIGLENEINSVFVYRQWTGEIYSPEFAAQFPGRDWILTRIMRLDGLELGRNKDGDVDSLRRNIYIHGTPNETRLGVPGSRGCIRMGNEQVIELADWIKIGARVYIE
jgi:hypothetical protein